MSKINDAITKAVANLENFSGGNTTVTYQVSSDKTSVILHGSLIVVHNHVHNKTTLNFCGFPTNITAGRINAVLKGLNREERVSLSQGKVILKPKNITFSAIEDIILN